MLLCKKVSLRPMTRPSRRHAGFTLVELLVVIGIIIILMSVLLPAINSVRELSRARTCSSHLQELGRIFKLRQSNLPGGQLIPEKLHRFFNEDLDGMEDTWICPSDVDQGQLSLGSGGFSNLFLQVEPPANARSSYGFNRRGHRMDTSDAEKILALDYDKLSVNVVGPANSEGTPSAEFREYVAPRHRTECNVLYYDLHVESQAPDLIDPATCWIHEDHWRPAIDVAYRLDPTGRDDCERPKNPVLTPTGNTDETDPDPEGEPEPCDKSYFPPQLQDDSYALLKGGLANSSQAAWTKVQNGYEGTSQAAPVSGNKISAEWTFKDLKHHQYELSITWVADAANATDVTITAYDLTADKKVKSFSVNMQEAPDEDFRNGDRPFQRLGKVEIKNGAMIVAITGAGNGNLNADAVRISCGGDESDPGPTGGGNTSGNTEDPPENPELLLLYDFDQQSGSFVKDGSNYHRDGSLNGNALNYKCQGNNGVVSITDSSFGFVDAPPFRMGGPFTISAWVKFDSFNGQAKVISLGGGATEISVGNLAGSPNAYFKVGGKTMTAPGFWKLGEWVHVSATLDDSGQMKLIGDSGAITGPNAPATDFERSPIHFGESFVGMIDDIRIYSLPDKTDKGDEPSGCEFSLEIHLPADNGSDPYANVSFLGVGYSGFPSGGEPAKWCNAEQTSGYFAMTGTQYLEFVDLGFKGNQSITVSAAIKLFAPILIDDSDGSVFGDPSSKWETVSSADAVGGSYHKLPLSGRREAYAAFYKLGAGQGLSAGTQYKVYAHWPSNSQYVSNAGYYVYDLPDSEKGMTPEQIKDLHGAPPYGLVNQTLPPSANYTYPDKDGTPRSWQLLANSNPAFSGTVTLTDGNLMVWVQRGNNGPELAADALLVMPASVPADKSPGGPLFGMGSPGQSNEFTVGIRSNPTTKVTEAYVTVAGKTAAVAAGNLGSWVTLTGKYDASSKTATVSVGGASESVMLGATTPDFTTDIYKMGAHGGGRFYGDIDDFYMYNKIESPSPSPSCTK